MSAPVDAIGSGAPRSSRALAQQLQETRRKPPQLVAGGCYEFYSNYPLQIQAVAASIVATG